MNRPLRIALLTNEFPPHIYGGAGVHIENLTRELSRLDDGAHQILVRSFGDQAQLRGNLEVIGVSPEVAPESPEPRHARFLDAMQRDVFMAGSMTEVDIVHCHTWYTHLAGCFVKQLHGARLILTTHSLEPHRPWKAEQLGTAYRASSWVERTAYQNADGVVAVSEAMRQDVHHLYGVPLDRIQVVHNGIDAQRWRRTHDPARLEKFGIDPEQPYVLFVGRITRQKGIDHLLRAVAHLRPGVPVVLAAGAPDTPEAEAAVAEAVARLARTRREPIVWIRQVMPQDDLIVLYSHAAVFVCPSVYEPFGIINLEAMACETPVVASAVGGIPEVVLDGETGLLVPFEPAGLQDPDPADPDRFARDLAAATNALLDDPARRAEMGERARARVTSHISRAAIAAATLTFYHRTLARSPREAV